MSCSSNNLISEARHAPTSVLITFDGRLGVVFGVTDPATEDVGVVLT